MRSASHDQANERMSALRARIRAESAELCGSGRSPGYLAGVYHDGEQLIFAEGVSNVMTGDAMSDTTGFLAGSITKVMTAMLMLQCVEHGLIDLDERVTTYLPALTLAQPSNVGELRIHNLLNHTNGIDGDLFWPDRVKGRDALTYYVEELRRCSMLFEPGEYVSYSNAGMLVAGRVLEVVTGRTYHELLARQIFEPIGMAGSCTSAEQAILRRTAVGHFFNPKTSKLRRTDMFMLPDSWSACGATPMTTIADLLSFARVHLDDGVAPTGTRVLSIDLTRRMQTITADMRSPNVSPMGLGWPFFPFGETPVLFHSGASPGGSAILMLVPERKFAFAAFGNSNAAGSTHDRLALWLLRDYLGLNGRDVVSAPVEVSDLSGFQGTYRSNQFRVDVEIADGRLEETMTFEPEEPEDEMQATILDGFIGGSAPMPPHGLVPVGDRLFAPAGVPLDVFNGFGRRMLASFHGGTTGRPEYRVLGGRMTRRAHPR
ncbi:MAG: serine hydrolase domain-containing protein [Polyangiaceae bacterium]